ncbi:unnamed protein product [Rotaria sp. Silwood2]|nr:unnamed protein product [Rotaria sp. Silwood2]CAF2931410.1 unnamed protein product [Rotaria sp. Silwood2]CAF3300926.1 unnamed protein product [Rotaria sp. Silwood2]CAF3979190.1 unnamed protein product [Rotaria sp. Silwood2]CAF4157555.1 unnamed protein product [Rotaria sp. Silwood2]
MSELDIKKFDVCVVGSCNVDLVSYVDRTPKIGETIEGNKFEKGFGGKGANQCVQAAKLGGKVAMIGKLGNDVFGKEYLDNLKQLGVNTDHVSMTNEAATGVAPIIVDKEGQNSIIVILGANLLLNEDDIEKAENIIRQSKIVVCQLEIRQETVAKVFEIARKYAVLTILNPAPMSVNFNRDLLKLADIICPNETEAEILCDISVETIDNAKKACQKLHELGCRKVIITMGSQGAVILNGEGQCEHVEIEKCSSVCDTTGAGDSFVGTLALLMAREEKMALKEQVKRACRVASQSVEKKGTQTSYPTKDELRFNLFE